MWSEESRISANKARSQITEDYYEIMKQHGPVFSPARLQQLLYLGPSGVRVLLLRLQTQGRVERVRRGVWELRNP